MSILAVVLFVTVLSLSPVLYFYLEAKRKKVRFSAPDNRPLLRRLASSLFEMNDVQYEKAIRYLRKFYPMTQAQRGSKNKYTNHAISSCSK